MARLFDVEQARLHRELVGIPEGQVHLRALHWNGPAAHPPLIPGTYTPERLEQLQQQGYRLYLIAGGAQSDPEVKSIPAVFVEWDDLLLEDVLALLHQAQVAGLPEHTLLLRTWQHGSPHVWWRLNEPCTDIPRWRALMERLVLALGSDPSCTNPSRLMRLAGSSYIAKAGHPKEGEVLGCAEILHEDPDATCTLEDLEAWVAEQFRLRPDLVELEKAVAVLRQRDAGEFQPPADAERLEEENQRTGKKRKTLLPPRSMEEIQTALAQLPHRESEHPETDLRHYHHQRMILLGLRDALYRLEAGKKDERITRANQKALEIATGRGWSAKAAAQVLGSSWWLSEGVFWGRAIGAGWEPPGSKANAGNGKAPAGAVVPVRDDAHQSETQSLQSRLTAASKELQQFTDAAPGKTAVAALLAAADDTLRWGDPELEPILAGLAQAIGALVGSEGGGKSSLSLIPFRDQLAKKFKAPPGHIKRLIEAAAQQWIAQAAALSAAKAAVQAEIDAPARAAREADEQKRRQEHLAQLSGMDAVLAAVGEGWTTNQHGEIVETRLSPGGLTDRVRAALGDRLGFDEMRLLPAVDRQVLPPNILQLLYVKLSSQGWVIRKEQAVDGLSTAAFENPFHPVRLYLQDIESDSSIEPIDLDEFYGFYHCIDPQQQRYLLIMLLAAAWRAMEPACPLKVCVILSGPQTTYKSESLRQLCGPEWFTDTRHQQDKDTLLAIHAAWFYELGEIDAWMDKRHSGELKNLVSPASDTLRPPFWSAMCRFDRASIFVGTTNRREFFTDETGNHRYPVVEIDEPIDLDGIIANRHRIWKAALALYRAGERPWLSQDDLRAAEQRSQLFCQQDPWTPMVRTWLVGGQFADGYRKAPEDFNVTTALIESGCARSDGLTKAHQMRMGAVLRDLGCQRDKNPRKTAAGRDRWWHPPVPDPGGGDAPTQPQDEAQPDTTSEEGGCVGSEASQVQVSLCLTQPTQPNGAILGEELEVPLGASIPSVYVGTPPIGPECGEEVVSDAQPAILLAPQGISATQPPSGGCVAWSEVVQGALPTPAMKPRWDAISATLHPEAPNEIPYESPERQADIRNERVPQHVREQRDADRLWEQQHLARAPEPDRCGPAAGPSSHKWLRHAQRLAADGLIPAQIANRLFVDGFGNVSGRDVKRALDRAELTL